LASELQARKVLAGTFVVVAERWRLLVKRLVIPFLLLLPVSFMRAWEAIQTSDTLLYLIMLVLQTLFAVTTHRLILLGEASVPEWGLKSWTMRESMFALHLFGVSAVAVLLLIILGLIPMIGGVVGLVTTFWFGSRVALVFPAIAIGQGVTIPLAWRLSRRHQLPLFMILFAFPFLAAPVFLLAVLPSILLTYTDAGFLGPYIVLPLWSLATALLAVLAFTALSLAYREVIRIEYGA
jgi:hypothetical protein